MSWAFSEYPFSRLEWLWVSIRPGSTASRPRPSITVADSGTATSPVGPTAVITPSANTTVPGLCELKASSQQ